MTQFQDPIFYFIYTAFIIGILYSIDRTCIQPCIKACKQKIITPPNTPESTYNITPNVSPVSSTTSTIPSPATMKPDYSSSEDYEDIYQEYRERRLSNTTHVEINIPSN